MEGTGLRECAYRAEWYWMKCRRQERSGANSYNTSVTEVTFCPPCAVEECPGAPLEQFRTHLCSQYHFSVYPGTGLATGRPLVIARGRVCIAPVWPKSLSIAPLQLKV